MITRQKIGLILMLLTIASCGRDTHSLPQPSAQSTSRAGKPSNSASPQSQDSSAKDSEKNSKPQASSPSTSDLDESSTVPLSPSKLAWDGEKFIGSASFALVPLE